MSLGVASSLESVRCQLSSHLSHVMAQQSHLRLEAFGSASSNDRAKNEKSSSSSSQRSSSPLAALRFSVYNILRPEFGRDAILKTRPDPKSSPLKAAGDVCRGRLSPQRSDGRGSPFNLPVLHSSHSSSNLSRSGSLESLASSKSSVTGASVCGSSASTTGSESGGSDNASSSSSSSNGGQQSLWPAWIYCTRYSDRPSSGPRSRRLKRPSGGDKARSASSEEKRPRTAFSAEQLAKLKIEFAENKYLTEQRRQKLSRDLGLNEQQIKIWFQNKRAKNKKASGHKNPLALQLMAQGLYNHSTVPVDDDGQEIIFPRDS